MCDLYLSFGRQQNSLSVLYLNELVWLCKQTGFVLWGSSNLLQAESLKLSHFHKFAFCLFKMGFKNSSNWLPFVILQIMSIAWSLTAVKFILKSVCCLASSSVTRSGIISWHSHRRPDRVRWGHSDTGHHNSTTAFYLTTVSVCSHLGRLHGWAKAEWEWRWQTIKIKI